MRLGLLGGTFDPVHRGHIDVAQAAREALGLDRVQFIPARLPPHRPQQPRASGYHRFAMVAVALAGLPGFEVSDLELLADGPSYTARTLARLQRDGFHPSQLFFITGADAFAEIATWHDYPALLDASHFVVVSRPGHAREGLWHRLPDLRSRFVDVPPGVDPTALRVDRTAVFLVEARTADASSTEVRRRLEADEPLDDLVPERVLSYIRQHRLYTPVVRAAGLLHDQD